MDKIKKTLAEDQAARVFEADRREAAQSLFLPKIIDILSNVDRDLENSIQ